MNILEPSSFDAILFGPNTFILFSLKKSTIPSTNGFSGPTITRSILFSNIKSFNFSKSFISISIFFDTWDVPALPGKQYISLTYFDFLIAKHIECTLQPLPIIPTFMYWYIN